MHKELTKFVTIQFRDNKYIKKKAVRLLKLIETKKNYKFYIPYSTLRTFQEAQNHFPYGFKTGAHACRKIYPLLI